MQNTSIVDLSKLQTERYIGIPYVVNGRDFNSVDCYGLVRLVYKEELGIELPNFIEQDINPSRVQDLIHQYKEGWERTQDIQAGDVITFRIAGIESHIGIAISSTHFLHAREGYSSAIERFSNSKWKHRITGSYKYNPSKQLVVNGVPHPLRTERITTAIPSGTTVLQLEDWIIKQYNIQPELKPYIRVMVNGIIVPDESKEYHVLLDSDCIEYRVVPQNDGALRTLLTVAVIVAAPQLALSLGSVGGVAMATAAGSLTMAGSLVSMGLTAVGMALVNAIAPVRPAQSTSSVNPGSAESQLLITGGANQSNPYGTIPFVLGRVRVTPPLGASTYSMFDPSGVDNYLRMLLVWGYGPLSIDVSSMKIGELPLSNYTDIQQVTLDRISEPTNSVLVLFNGIYGKDITQVTSNVELAADGAAGAAITGPWVNAVSTDGSSNNFSVALHFPQGCRRIVSTGQDPVPGTSLASPVSIEIQYKKVSSDTWLSVPLVQVGDAPIKDAFTKVVNVDFNSDENVQVRVRRLTGTGNTAPADQNYQWLFTSTFLNTTFSRNSSPAIDPVNCKIAKTAFSIKATNQFNSQIEGINAIVQTYGKSWNGTAWVDGPINNPAALFRHLLEHPANPRRVTDTSKLDLVQLQHWHEYCTAKGFTFNSIVGATRSVLDVLRDICAAGRASPAMVDGKWTAIIDEPKTSVIQHFSPHNSWGFEGTKALPRIPDGLRVSFINEDKNYQSDETIVYATTSSKDNAALLESISVPGVTKLAQAQDHARWHMAQAKLRPETYTLNTDIEYIVCNRGDRVKVMHDVPMWGLGSGRIKNKISSFILELTEDVPITTSTTYGIRIRSSLGVSSERTIKTSFAITQVQRISGICTCYVAYHPLSEGDVLTTTIAGAGSSCSSANAVVTQVTPASFSYISSGGDIAQVSATGSAVLHDDNYSFVALTSSIDDTSCSPDDLFLYGEINKESQDCIVLSIEPMTNKSARITLVDYGVTSSANIFTDYLNYTNNLAFESGISLPPLLNRNNYTSSDVPIVTNVYSDNAASTRISPGVWQYNIAISYINTIGIPLLTTDIECQYDFSSASTTEGIRNVIVPIGKGSIYIPNVKEGVSYKFRLRYINSDGVTGPFTSWFTHVVSGLIDSTNTSVSIQVQRVTKYLRVTPFLNSTNLPENFKGYEIKVYKNSGTGDFWDVVDAAIVQQFSTGVATISLRDFSSPRLSTSGTKYRVACRVISTSNNYISTAAISEVILTSLT